MRVIGGVLACIFGLAMGCSELWYLASTFASNLFVESAFLNAPYLLILNCCAAIGVLSAPFIVAWGFRVAVDRTFKWPGFLLARKPIVPAVAVLMALPLALILVLTKESANDPGAEPSAAMMTRYFYKNRPLFEPLASSIVQQGNLRGNAELVSHLGLIGSPGMADDGEIDFALWGEGCAPCTDIERGIAYVPSPPDDLVADLDKARPEQKTFKIYQRLEGRWYLYINQVD